MSNLEGPIKVVLATDNFLVGDGLAALLAGRPEVEVVGRANDHDELVGLVEALEPEAVLVTIRTPAVTTMAIIKTARRLRAEHPDLGIVVISDRGNGFALELLRGGASRVAYLLDEHLAGLDSVIGALREVRDGQTVLDPSVVDSLVERRDGIVIDDLTVRELDVLEQIAHGLSNAAIAAALYVSIKSVEKNVTTIFRKLGLTDPSLVDRRVTAGLIYTRAQTSAFSRHLPTPVDEI
ncbi:MAG: LuxR C-terminal-related transcriptional regulator [Microthrixaceae bacterium]